MIRNRMHEVAGEFEARRNGAAREFEGVLNFHERAVGCEFPRLGVALGIERGNGGNGGDCAINLACGGEQSGAVFVAQVVIPREDFVEDLDSFGEFGF